MKIAKDLPYDYKYLIRCCYGMGAIVAVMYATGGAGFAAALILLFMALSRNNIELLFFTMLATMSVTIGNCALMPKGAVFGIAQRVLLMALACAMIVKISSSRKSRYLSSFLLLLAYLAYMIIPSFLGWCPVISFLKLFLFVMVYMAFFGVANGVITNAKVDAKKIRSIFLTIAGFFILGSVLLIPFPGIGQMNDKDVQDAMLLGRDITSLFMGMTFHSQALGATISALGVLLYTDLIFSVKKPDRLYLILLCCLPILVWKTSSRTAMGSFLAGIMFATYFFMRASNQKRTWKTKVTRAITMLFLALSVAIVVVPSVRSGATSFVLKYNKDKDAAVSLEEITMSRQMLWEIALYNFKQEPLFGNGFQVSEDQKGLKFSFANISAPVEKGTWAVAVLEEGGVIGMIFFGLFALVAMFSLIGNRCYQGATAFFMLLLTNLGEFTMFSTSSVGGMLWALVFTGVILDGLRIREDREAKTVPQDGIGMGINLAPRFNR